MKPKIVIDAGHGGFDSGSSYKGRKEKDDTLKLALAVGKKLQEDGYPIVYTRTTDVYQKPVDKAKIGNESEADYFVSIHRNSSPNPNTFRGIQTLVYKDEGQPAVLARNINEELETVGFKDLGVSVRPDLAVLRRTKMPAVLVEAGFINTDSDNQLFDQNFQQIADAIAKGIEESVQQPQKQFGVQIGLYRRYENALYALNEIEMKGYKAQIREWKEYYAVIVGEVDSIEEARTLEKELSKEGYDTLIVNL